MTEEMVERREVVVKGTPEHAFAVFTERFDAIKPREHNMLGSPNAPHRFVFAWDIGPTWQIEAGRRSRQCQ